MKVSRALIGAGTGLLVVYAVAIGAYLAKSARAVEVVVPDDGTIRYAVVTATGESHVVENAADDPAGVLEEAGRRFGEISSVTKLEPGAPMPEVAGTSMSKLGPLALVALLFPVGLLLVGFRARSRALQVRKLWTVISPTLTADASALERHLNVDERGLMDAVKRLNEEGRAQLVFDTHSKRVYDRRLSDETITVQFCPRCNDPVNVRVLADLLHVPQCPSCMYPIDRHELDRLKANIVQRLRNDGGGEVESDFSIGTFVTLAILFPPGAIYYGVRHS